MRTAVSCLADEVHISSQDPLAANREVLLLSICFAGTLYVPALGSRIYYQGILSAAATTIAI